jgi:phage minor structural protein
MKKRNPIYIFDQDDNLLAIADDYITAPFEDSINQDINFEVVIDSQSENAQFIKEENQVAFKDREGNFRLFTIKELEATDGSLTETRAICLPAREELADEPIEDLRPQDKTAAFTLGVILQNSRWQPGNVADLGLASTNFYYTSALSAIEKLLKVWGGEIVDRIEIQDNKIAGRYIDILYRRGGDKGKRFEIEKDIDVITRTVLSYPITAIYGIGSSTQTEAGGYTRKLKFGDITWSTANGDPADKPAGQEWIGDPEALQKYGRKMPDGTRRHRWGWFEDSQEKDPSVLIQKSWDELQRRKELIVSYDMSVLTYEGLAGYEHEQAGIGDTAAIIDKQLGALLETRIIVFKYDIGDDTTGDVNLGNFIDYLDDDNQVDKIADIVNEKSGLWDQSDTGPITDEDIEDITPSIPTGITARGLYKTIMIDWNYDPSIAIAAYEVYASQIPGFIPDATNLVWRGKTGGFVFEADTDQTWYFKIRALNPHGTASEYSTEFLAQTVRVSGQDIEPQTITTDLIAETFKLDFGYISNVEITNAHITGILDANKIKVGSGTTYESGYDPSTKEGKMKIRYIRDWLNGSTSNTGNHWVEIKAINGEGQNVALNKTESTYPILTDGSTDTNAYTSPTGSSGLTWVEIDLGETYDDIDHIHVWHYYADGRTYHDNKVEVSEDGVNWITIFDAALSGEYPETSAGRKHTVNAGAAIANSNSMNNLWRYENSTEIDGGKIRAQSVTANAIKVATLDAITADLGTMTAGVVNGVTIISESTDSDILIQDGYIMNAKDRNDPTANNRAYLQDGYLLTRSAGTAQYTQYEAYRILHQDLQSTGTFQLYSNTGVSIEGSGGFKVNSGDTELNGNVFMRNNIYMEFDNTKKLAWGLTGSTRLFIAPTVADGSSWNWNREFGYNWTTQQWYVDGGLETSQIYANGDLGIKSANGSVFLRPFADSRQGGYLHLFALDSGGTDPLEFLYRNKADDVVWSGLRFGDPDMGGGVVEARGPSGVGKFQASSFDTVSQKNKKKDIVPFNREVLEELKKLQPYRYNYKTDREIEGLDPLFEGETPQKLGIMFEDAPTEIQSAGGAAVDNYGFITLLLKGIQEVTKRLEVLEELQ